MCEFCETIYNRLFEFIFSPCKRRLHKFLPPANEVWAKVIFLHLFVILFTGGSASVHAGIPPPLNRAHTPGPGTPPDQATPWHRTCWKIRSTCRRYSSYWNAILLIEVLLWLKNNVFYYSSAQSTVPEIT